MRRVVRHPDTLLQGLYYITGRYAIVRIIDEVGSVVTGSYPCGVFCRFAENFVIPFSIVGLST